MLVPTAPKAQHINEKNERKRCAAREEGKKKKKLTTCETYSAECGRRGNRRRPAAGEFHPKIMALQLMSEKQNIPVWLKNLIAD